jgi:ubiquinone/menaquinone biosynthesis C-methylase UbiE
MKKILNLVHNHSVFQRRVSVLAKTIGSLIDSGGRGLDVGCGDGSLALSIQKTSPGLVFEGVDVLARPEVRIPFNVYDGKRLPFDDDSFDWLIIVDVLHHTDDPLAVLSECFRVCKGKVIIKDHLCETEIQRMLLVFMDWVGNRGHDVRLPYNYLRKDQWDSFFSELHVNVLEWDEDVKLYSQPFEFVFGGGLHFISMLSKDEKK